MMIEAKLAALKNSVENTDVDTIRALSDALLQDVTRLGLKPNNNSET